MPLNKAKGNMYPFIDYTWNPVKGKCPYDCSYCYVSRMFKRFKKEQKPLVIDCVEAGTDLGKYRTIFVCSGCDLFHPAVPDEWILDVTDKTLDWWDNTYLWHTKNPGRASEFLFPPKSILCATVESNIPWPGISKAPQPYERIEGLRQWHGPRMITIEPVMDFDVMTFSEMIISCKPEQVNIGADSGRNGLPEPSTEKIAALIEALRPFTKVYLKKNLKRLYQEVR
jgi:protein gp37